MNITGSIDIASTPEFLEKYPTFCLLPFFRLSTNTRGDVRPCCVAGSEVIRDGAGKTVNVSATTLNAAWNAEGLKDLRKSLLNGEKPSACKTCWKAEELGHTSNRQQFNTERFEKCFPSLVNNLEPDGSMPFPESIEIRFSNVCNLKCRTCSPFSSSSWQAERPRWEHEPVVQRVFGQLDGKKHWDATPEIIKEIIENGSRIKEIRALGGEPLIQKEFLNFVDALVENDSHKNIEMAVVTNGEIKDYSIFTKLRQFKKLNLTLSIDGIERENEYIRSGSTWAATNAFFKYGLSIRSPHYFKIMITTSLFNIFTLDKLVQWVTKQFLAENLPAQIYFIMLNAPKIMSLNNLHPKILNEQLDKVENILRNIPEFDLEASGFNNLRKISFDQTEADTNNVKLIAHTRILDGIRKQSYRDSLQKFSEYLANAEPTF